MLIEITQGQRDDLGHMTVAELLEVVTASIEWIGKYGNIGGGGERRSDEAQALVQTWVLVRAPLDYSPVLQALLTVALAAPWRGVLQEAAIEALMAQLDDIANRRG
jgi:hypothetical protein